MKIVGTNKKSAVSVKAKFISINQITCMIPRFELYSLRLTYNNKIYSESLTLLIYSSLCYGCTDTGCHLKEGSKMNCIINGMCYPKEALNPVNKEYWCDPSVNKLKWTTIGLTVIKGTTTTILHFESTKIQSSSSITKIETSSIKGGTTTSISTTKTSTTITKTTAKIKKTIMGTIIDLTTGRSCVEIQPKNPVSCLADLKTCASGVTLSMRLAFVKRVEEGSVLFSTGGDDDNAEIGWAMFYKFNSWVLKAVVDDKKWELAIPSAVTKSYWQEFMFSWHKEEGLIVYVGGMKIAETKHYTKRLLAKKLTLASKIVFGCSATLKTTSVLHIKMSEIIVREKFIHTLVKEGAIKSKFKKREYI